MDRNKDQEPGSSAPIWSGRFSGAADEAAFALNASLAFDRRMSRQDVRGSLAWGEALLEAGVLTEAESATLRDGLRQIDSEFEAGTFSFHPSDEDIHTAVERRLGELIGPLAGKLHTGRSRNDQVATDFRLWLLDHLPQLDEATRLLQTVLLERASQDLMVLTPGYTHFQRGQPILLGHWWLSHFWPLQRDRQRLAALRETTAVLPLGSGALAGVPFALDRQKLAVRLGFERPSPNSLDAVADRDFAIEFLFAAALIGVHLSRLSEAVVLYSSSEFGFFELDDAFATGSSLMPQKKNPDHFELARGKAGTLIGKLAGLLATLKGLPGAYDKDLQEDKAPVFEAVDTLLALLPVLAGALRTLKIHPERMRQSIDPAMLATDLADFLVARGIPFRKAHEAVGQVVRRGQALEVPIDRLDLSELQAIHPAFDSKVSEVFDPMASVNRRSAYGGTGEAAVKIQLEEAGLALKQGRVEGSQIADRRS